VRIRPRRDVPAEIAVAAIFRTHRQAHTRARARAHTHCVRTCNQTAETAFAIPLPPFQRPLTLLASPRDPERSERANRLDCRPKTFAGHYERNDQSLKSSKGEGHASHECRVMNVQTLPVSWRPHLETLNRPRDSDNIHRGFIAPCRMARGHLASGKSKYSGRRVNEIAESYRTEDRHVEDEEVAESPRPVTNSLCKK